MRVLYPKLAGKQVRLGRDFERLGGGLRYPQATVGADTVDDIEGKYRAAARATYKRTASTSASGDDGPQGVLELLQSDLGRYMAMIGAPNLQSLTRSMIRRVAR